MYLILIVAPIEMMNFTINTTYTCKSNSCCVNVTLNITLVRYNKYFIKLTNNPCRYHQTQM